MIQSKPTVRDSLVQALGNMVPNGQMGGGAASGQLPDWMSQAVNRNGGRPAMPINAGGYTTKPLPLATQSATTKPLPMSNMENGQRLKIDPARINNYVRPNLLAGQRKPTMTSAPSFNKPLGAKKPVKKPAKKPVKG